MLIGIIAIPIIVAVIVAASSVVCVVAGIEAREDNEEV